MQRREFITLFGSATAALPFAARAEQPTMPVVGLINAGAPESAADRMTAFRKGLNETGYVEGQSVAIEYRWAEGRYESIPDLVADLLRHRVAIIPTGSTDAALAAKTATEAVPIVFADGEDPVKLGLVASLARPGGNVTGVAVPPTELGGKRMRLLRELVPRATSIGVLLNPARPAFDAQSKAIQEAARAVRQEIRFLEASSEHEIDFAFAIAAQWQAAALIVAPDAFLDRRREQLVTRAKSYAIPTIYHDREFVAAGGLVSYGTSIADGYRKPAFMRAGFSRAKSQQTYQSCNPRNSNSSSTWALLRRSASTCQPRCSPALTRSSNSAPVRCTRCIRRCRQ